MRAHTPRLPGNHRAFVGLTTSATRGVLAALALHAGAHTGVAQQPSMPTVRPPGAAATQAPRRIDVPDAPSCATCTLELVPVARLGRESDSVTISFSSQTVARDSQGRFYAAVSDGDRIGVYGPDGRLVTVIGRKGQGPGEFQNIDDVHVGPGDTLYVLEADRLSVFAPLGRFLRTVKLPLVGSRVARVPDGLLIQPALDDDDVARMPLRVLSLDGTQIRGFGADSSPPAGAQPAAPAPNMMPPIFTATLGVRGDVWITRQTRFIVHQWQVLGREDLMIVRQAPWFPNRDRTEMTDPMHKTEPKILFVQQDSASRLLVGIMAASPSWRPVTMPAVETSMTSPAMLQLMEDMTKMHETILELIDPVARRVIARSHVAPLIVGSLGTDLVYSVGVGNADFHLDIWRVQLKRP
jgi:hypothetical protein